MAVSRLTLSNPDLVDVASVMEAFETINNCAITLHGRVGGPDGSRRLELIVSALEDLQDGPDQRYLASVNVNMSPVSHRTIEGAILWALYQLDWQLAQTEWDKTNKTA